MAVCSVANCWISCMCWWRTDWSQSACGLLHNLEARRSVFPGGWSNVCSAALRASVWTPSPNQSRQCCWPDGPALWFGSSLIDSPGEHVAHSLPRLSSRSRSCAVFSYCHTRQFVLNFYSFFFFLTFILQTFVTKKKWSNAQWPQLKNLEVQSWTVSSIIIIYSTVLIGFHIMEVGTWDSGCWRQNDI